MRFSITQAPLLRQGSSQTTNSLSNEDAPQTNTRQMEQPPPYRTYPFVLGMSGIVLGTSLGSLTTALQPDIYEKIEADGTHHELLLSYGKYGGHHLKEALYNKYKENIVENPHGGKKSVKVHEMGSAFFKLGNKELNVYNVEMNKQFLHQGDIVDLDKHQFFAIPQDNHAIFHNVQFHNQPETSIQEWCEMEISPQQIKANPLFQNMTHAVSVQMNAPILLNNTDIRHANQTLQVLYATHDDQQAHLLLPDGKTLHTVSLSPEGRIINSKVEGLDGIPIKTYTHDARQQIDRIVRNVPAYIEEVKSQLSQTPKKYIQTALQWAAFTGAIGYGLGWALDWHKRRSRQKSTLAQ
jgi:hypothetical protein